MTELYEQITALIDGPASDLETIERTPTDGYAQALHLEAEKWRLEKRAAKSRKPSARHRQEGA